MIWSEREERYIPVLWILVSGKSKRCYVEVISWVARCLPAGKSPKVHYSGIDFEPAFYNALKLFFPDAFKIGCDFHLKQAHRKELLRIGMPKEITDAILSSLDYARVLPDDEIIRKGVPFLQDLVLKRLKEKRVKMNRESQKLWKAYWEDYFLE